MTNHIYLRITSKYIYCDLTSEGLNKTVSYRSDHPDLKDIDSRSVKNNVDKARKMGQAIQAHLDPKATYHFISLGLHKKYHGRVKAFLDQLTSGAEVINISNQ